MPTGTMDRDRIGANRRAGRPAPPAAGRILFSALTSTVISPGESIVAEAIAERRRRPLTEAAAIADPRFGVCSVAP